MTRYFCAAAFLFLSSLLANGQANAQTSVTQPSIVLPNSRFSFEELLNNRLRTSTVEQKAYISFLIKQVRKERLDIKLVLAIQKKAIGKNPVMPFPYFERAMRFEAARRNVILPPAQQFARPGTRR